MNKELAMGIKIEKEHKDVYDFMKKNCKLNKCPSANAMFHKIAIDHIKEDKRYYTKLKKAKL